MSKLVSNVTCISSDNETSHVSTRIWITSEQQVTFTPHMCQATIANKAEFNCSPWKWHHYLQILSSTIHYFQHTKLKLKETWDLSYHPGNLFLVTSVWFLSAVRSLFISIFSAYFNSKGRLRIFPIFISILVFMPLHDNNLFCFIGVFLNEALGVSLTSLKLIVQFCFQNNENDTFYCLFLRP